jgi:hypothetical protein
LVADPADAADEADGDALELDPEFEHAARMAQRVAQSRRDDFNVVSFR